MNFDPANDAIDVVEIYDVEDVVASATPYRPDPNFDPVLSRWNETGL